jgi:NAD(P)-dependent dehydrogenase (short-subunit alcohol dehydrogenase family)
MTVLDTFSLAGQVAVVTGGNRGLGRAFAHALGEAGASIAIIARDVDKNAEVVAELAEKGITAAAFVGDVASHADVERAAGEILSAYGRVDVLVNNAGTCIHRPALEVTQQEWDQVIDVNVTGVWNGCQVFGKHMIDAGGGVIVNVGSISALIVNRPQWQPAYNASKAAVHQLTKSLAAEWAPHGVRVNAVAPGYVKTEMTPIDRPEFKRHWIDDVPQQRAATPEEIAPSVLFLASPAAGFMTGSILVIDGGYTVF